MEEHLQDKPVAPWLLLTSLLTRVNYCYVQIILLHIVLPKPLFPQEVRRREVLGQDWAKEPCPPPTHTHTHEDLPLNLYNSTQDFFFKQNILLFIYLLLERGEGREKEGENH